MLAFSSLKSGAYNKGASVMITSDDTKALCSEYFIGKKKNKNTKQVRVQFPLVLPDKEAQSRTEHPTTCLHG